MNEQYKHTDEPTRPGSLILAELVPEPAANRPPSPPSQPQRPKIALPLGLFILTCLSTFMVGGRAAGLISEFPLVIDLDKFLWGGFCYAVPLMTILICHEAGHFLQALRYRVTASYPYFIPMPFSPIGTMGAVIAMSSNMRDRRALFDIGISGPLAGLVPTIIFCVLGLHWSEVLPLPLGPREYLGEPLLFKFIIRHVIGELPPGHDVFLHPTAFAGWVGLLITSLNLFPIGQLDGGHIFYALLLKKSYRVAPWILKFGALAALYITVAYANPIWILMIVLLFIMGPKHSPTANDNVPLGRARIILGWATLTFVLIGFTPMPIFQADPVAERAGERAIEQLQKIKTDPRKNSPSSKTVLSGSDNLAISRIVTSTYV